MNVVDNVNVSCVVTDMVVSGLENEKKEKREE